MATTNRTVTHKCETPHTRNGMPVARRPIGSVHRASAADRLRSRLGNSNTIAFLASGAKSGTMQRAASEGTDSAIQATGAAGLPGRGWIYPKLDVGAADHPLEREADAVADQVMRMKEGACCASCAAGGACEEVTVRRKPDAPAASRAPLPRGLEQQVRRLTTGGAPLSPSLRAFFEPRMGRDLGSVRVHDDGEAQSTAGAVRAKAFTLGEHIAFGPGHWAPDSGEGRRLLAHELTHVIQQRPTVSLPMTEGRSAAQPRSLTRAHTGNSGDQIARQSDGGADAGVPSLDPMDAGASGGLPDEPGGARYSRQAACVARLGGCTTTRDAGPVEPTDIAKYNRDCKEKTGYAGPDITPSEDECRQYTTGALIDPAKISRLQTLNMQYLERLGRGEIRLADAQQIDGALRRAYAALQRGGAALPGLPAAVVPPPGMSPDGPAVILAGLPAFAVAPESAAGAAATAGPTLTVIEGGAAVTGGAEVTAGGAAVAGGTAAATVGVVLIGLAAAVGVGLVIYWIFSLEDPAVDPTIPRALDEANETIQRTLDSAQRPTPQPAPAPRPTPVPGPRRWKEKQTCEDNVLDALEK